MRNRSVLPREDSGLDGPLQCPNFGSVCYSEYILAIMISPIISSLTRDIHDRRAHQQLRPSRPRRTPGKMIRSRPANSRIGIVGALCLVSAARWRNDGLTMVMQSRRHRQSLFAPANTLAASLRESFRAYQRHSTSARSSRSASRSPLTTSSTHAQSHGLAVTRGASPARCTDMSTQP